MGFYGIEYIFFSASNVYKYKKRRDISIILLKINNSVCCHALEGHVIFIPSLVSNLCCNAWHINKLWFGSCVYLFVLFVILSDTVKVKLGCFRQLIKLIEMERCSALYTIFAFLAILPFSFSIFFPSFASAATLDIQFKLIIGPFVWLDLFEAYHISAFWVNFFKIDLRLNCRQWRIYVI